MTEIRYWFILIDRHDFKKKIFVWQGLWEMGEFKIRTAGTIRIFRESHAHRTIKDDQDFYKVLEEV